MDLSSKLNCRRCLKYIYYWMGMAAMTCWFGLLLLIAPRASAQPAEYSTETGILEIPSVVINKAWVITESEFQLQDAATMRFRLVDYAIRQDPGIHVIDLAYGESTILDDGRTLQFVDVMRESRCPTPLFCINSGEVTVILRITESLVSGNTLRTDFGLTLGGTDISAHYDSGAYYRLAQAEPYPIDGMEVSDEDYVIEVEYSALPFKN